jgi:Tfp pilus assembly protein PilV
MKRSGFSLIETLTALTLVTVALLPMLALAASLDRQSESASRYEEALAVARAALERCRREPFPELAKGTVPAAEPAAATSKIQVQVTAAPIEDGLVKLTAVATWPSAPGSTGRIELASLVGDPDRSMSTKYALEVVK